METISDFDAMIVGAGPAGASTWLHLHRYAAALAERTLVIEKAAMPRDKLCAGGLGAWSDDVLRTLAIDLDIPCLHIPDIEFSHGDQRWRYRTFRPFRMVARKDLDHLLWRTAIDRGMRVQAQEEYLAAREERAGLTVETSRGRYRLKALVGADGALSRVRRLMAAPAGIGLAPTLQITAPANPRYDKEFDRKTMRLELLPIDSGMQGYIWHCPCLKKGVPHMHHGIVHFRLQPGLPAGRMKTALCRALETRHIHAASQVWGSHPIRWFSDRAPVSKPHVLLVGDAAGIEPAFGGGLHMALSYGELAARALVQSFADHEFSFGDYAKRLKAHFLGRHIDDYTQLALSLYAGEPNPLDRVRRFFSRRSAPRDLMALLMGLNRAR